MLSIKNTIINKLYCLNIENIILIVAFIYYIVLKETNFCHSVTKLRTELFTTIIEK